MLTPEPTQAASVERCAQGQQWMDQEGVWHDCVVKPCPTCGESITGDTEADWGTMLGWHRALDKCSDEQARPSEAESPSVTKEGSS